MNFHKENVEAIKAGNLASQKGVNRKVREYGKRLVIDRKYADAQLKATLPNGLPQRLPAETISAAPKQNDILLRLLKRTDGNEFDREFLGEMYVAQDDLLQELNSAYNTLKNGKLRRMIERQIPIIRQDRDLAARLVNFIPPWPE